MSLILQVNNNSGGNPSPSQTQQQQVQQQHHHVQQPQIVASGGPITLAKPPVQVAIAAAVKHHHHPLLEHHHIVQQQSGPSTLDGRGTTTTLRMPITLPQSPIRAHHLPVTASQSPIRHLPQTPLPQATIHRGIRNLNKSSNNTTTATHCIMVNHQPPGRNPTHLSMLPQAPAPGLLPAAPGPGILSTTVGLIPIPRMQLQQPQQPQSSPSITQMPSHISAAPLQLSSASSSSTILPPNTLHHQLFPSSSNRIDSSDELDVTEPPEHFVRNKSGRISSPKLRYKNQPAALQDHNYASRPPLTPTPPPSLPIVSQPSLSSVIVNQQQPASLEHDERHQQQQQKSFNHAAPEFVGHETVASTTPNNSPLTAQSSTTSRTQANLNSIQEAGVGPMAPLVEDDSVSVSSTDDKGEETETAPEAEAEDDSITRCICDFLHDDGYMICCDKCSVWQHVVCMGLDRNNIPDEYLCEVCKPRQIDRKRAKSLQARRRTEIFKNSSSSDDEHNENKNSNSNKRNNNISKKIGDSRKNLSDSKISLQKKQKLKKSSSDKDIVKNSSNASKKQYRKKKNSGSSLHNNNGIKKSSRRKPSYHADDDDDDEDEEFEDEDDLEPKFESGQQLRSWIDQYEEAVTNHYSPELRARLTGNKHGPGELRSTVIGGPTRCTVSLQGNGIKILTANSNLSANTPVIECKGRIMLASQYRASNKDADIITSPYVLFYRITEFLEIVVDGKTYGNDSRFCRRSSSNHNAELRHVVDKGSLHIFIVTTKALDKYQEILLPTEPRRLPPRNNGSFSSIQDDVREIRGKPNGLLRSPLADDEDEEDVEAEGDDEINLPSPAPAQKERRKKRNSERSALKKSSLKNKAHSKKIIKPKIEVTTSHDDADEEEECTEVNDKSNGEIKHEEDEIESQAQTTVDSNVSAVSPPIAKPQPPPTKSSPNKLGLPDSSGLIVGVNTINYDASSALRNKSKSREERKMEMIMKAIEAMEKAEQRKKEHNNSLESHISEKPAVKRRRSNSVKCSNPDSNLDASSADESKPPEFQQNKKIKRKGKKNSMCQITATSPQGRRNRVLSGGSADETPSSSSGDYQFRFPKTKKMIVSDWLHQEEDDVSSNYLRGSRSPPGIATHLLRSAPLSPVKPVCSAKKRWLRQAISEDHSEDLSSSTNIKHEEETGEENPSVASASSEFATDNVTPLKKRRLANYKEESEANLKNEFSECSNLPSVKVEEAPSEDSKVPNALKKKLLQNLVLEAVLDSAMEDMLGNVAPEDSVSNSKVAQEFELKEEEVCHLKKEVENQNIFNLSRVEEPVSSEIKTEPLIEEDKIKDDPLKEEMSKEEQAIKTPEPSSVFKSFFKSNVSIEDLEAELEASKRQRESIKDDEDVIKSEEHTDRPPSEEKEHDNNQTTHTSLNFVEEKLSPSESNQSSTDSMSSKPKEKKRVSLADYKRRRKQESVSSDTSLPTSKEIISPPLPSSQPSTLPSSLPSAPALSGGLSILSQDIITSDEPGTPTLDEDQPVTMPTLNTLPLFEKLEQLEKAQRENNKKKVVSNSLEPPPTTKLPERKREDLTERLKKEFGLVVEEPHEDVKCDGDATPESSSPKIVVPPPPHPPAAHHNSRFTSFTPTQYPSYPSNYPLPPYPASKTAAAPHPPPSAVAAVASNSQHSRRGSSSSSHSPGTRSYYSSSSSSRDGRYRDRDYREKDHHHHHSSSHRSSSRSYRNSYYP